MYPAVSLQSYPIVRGHLFLRDFGGHVLPHHRVSADDELGPGVPLVVGDVVVRLQPDPLLALGEKPVVARLPLPILQYCRGGREREREREKDKEREGRERETDSERQRQRETVQETEGDRERGEPERKAG